MDEQDVLVDWQQVWGDVATTLSGHWAAGRGHLLTGDTLRLATVVALESAGVDPSRVALEDEQPGATSLGLLVDGPDGTVIDLRHPRVVRGGAGPDAITMGDLLGDFHRLAAVSAGQRWIVQALNRRVMGYLTSAAGRHGVAWPATAGSSLALGRDVMEQLPPAATSAIDPAVWKLPVVATCAGHWELAGELTLYAFEVETPNVGHEPEPLVVRPAPSEGASAPGESPAGTARAEIVAAMKSLTTRTRNPAVTVVEVVEELRRNGSRFAEPTVRTMLTTHMCADVSGRGIAAYDDVERIGDESYRLRVGR